MVALDIFFISYFASLILEFKAFHCNFKDWDSTEPGDEPILAPTTDEQRVYGEMVLKYENLKNLKKTFEIIEEEYEIFNEEEIYNNLDNLLE